MDDLRVAETAAVEANQRAAVAQVAQAEAVALRDAAERERGQTATEPGARQAAEAARQAAAMVREAAD